MAASLKVSRQAYGKIFLHAAKNFDSLILGYIIGTESNGQFSITDVLPVSHSNPAGPILEISGDVADTMFEQPNQIVGIYYASADINNEEPGYNVQRVVAGVTATLGRDCLVLKVCNKLLSSKDKVFLEASKGKSQLKVELADSLAYLSSLLDALLIQKIQHLFVDFEDHMNSSADESTGSPAADFRNPIASNFILHYTQTK